MQFQACAYCEHPNPVGTNYCNDCGAALHVKPCRNCGTVAVANASHCPACRMEFPVRPTIDVDMPWAVPTRPPAFSGRLASLTSGLTSGPSGGTGGAAASHPVGSGAQLAAATEALAQTRNLIEKASLRTLPQQRLEAAPPPRRPATGAQPQRVSLPGRQMGSVPEPTPDETRLWQGPPRESVFEGRPVQRTRPVFVITLLGLVSSVALLYLIQFAGSEPAGVTHQVSSPYKLLLRSAGTTPSVPVEPVVTEVPAATAGVPAVAPISPAPAVPAMSPLPGLPASPVVPVAPAMSVVPMAPAAAADAAPVPADAPAAAAPQLATSAPPASASDASQAKSVMQPAADAPPTPTETLQPMAAAQAGPPSEADSEAQPGSQAPGAAATDAAVPDAATPAGCRRELQALNLCGKVSPPL